ncbi:MAG: tetratricopeptide repeat protein [Treponema sp.]|nr:tetratricopeptide repeat protein [Treponema sp.]
MTLRVRGFAGYGLVFSFCISCTGLGYRASAEEYYAIGMAYLELEKYTEAAQWLNRAKAVDKTKTASEYNLGRIAFETKEYAEALRYFEKLLKKDPVNLMVLKAAAYTHIKLGNLEEALALYGQVLALAPESADDGYNYALVLYVMEKYDQSEQVLGAYPFALQEHKDALLLFARAQKAQQKPEAVESYARWFEAAGEPGDPQVRYEYASALEAGGFYARAAEAYRTLLKELPQQSLPEKELSPSQVRYALARLLLIADPENEEGITELTEALKEGFDDREALESLMTEEGISEAHKEVIRRLIDEGPKTEDAPEEPPASEQAPEDSLDDTGEV